MKKTTRSIRIPDDLYETIAVMARQEERTTGNMIIVLLKRAVDRENRNVAPNVAAPPEQRQESAS